MPGGCVFVTVKGAGVGTVFPGVAAAIGRDIYAFEPRDGLSRKFVEFALRHTVLSLIGHAVGDIPGLSRAHLTSHTIGLPPTAEQRRIVSAIESYFSRLDDAVASLERVQRNLKRYRAAVLQAAVEGRLVPTEAELARAEGRAYEPAEVLLKRILAERRKRMGAKYKEPVAPDTSGLPDLPEGWCWATLGQLAWDASYGTSAKCSYGKPGVPVLRIPNVCEGQIDFTDLKSADGELGIEPHELVAPGDFLIIRTNGSRDLIARGALVESSPTGPHFFASYLIRFRLVFGDRLGRWLRVYWHASGTRLRLESMAATSAGQYNVSMSELSAVPVPIPPLTEQVRIAQEADRLLSIAKSVAGESAETQCRVTGMRQAILSCAFSGRLVDQDPTDEPASDLLERIRASRPPEPPNHRAKRGARARAKR